MKTFLPLLNPSPYFAYGQRNKKLCTYKVHNHKNFIRVDINTHLLIPIKFKNNYLCQWFHWPNVCIRTKENVFKLCLFLIHSLNRQLLWRIISACSFWLFFFCSIVLIKKSLELTKKSNLNNLPRGKLKCIWTHDIILLLKRKQLSGSLIFKV